MKQAKKIFTRICLNNWGGIDHQIIHLNEYVNLFSGKSGSGKSTVMDAIQVLLYGSFSSNFLNKAADDAKNKRSVLSYLRGEQKDGSANRAGRDFCSVIAMEIKDTGNDLYTCIGIVFEVGKNDSEIKKFDYFSHSGMMPEDEYCTDKGYVYGKNEIKKLRDERIIQQEQEPSRKGDVNRIYPSKEAYLSTLYDVILGYIDGNRFVTMEKSAIALKMTNGTGQFIKDYMFPKSTGTVIEKISEQLGAYRDIKEKIDDLKVRIDLLTEIKNSGNELVKTRTDLIMTENYIRCIEIKDINALIENFTDDKNMAQEELDNIKNQLTALDNQKAIVEAELISAMVELESSDLGVKEEKLHTVEERISQLEKDERQWIHVTEGLNKWVNDEVVGDYLTNRLINSIEKFTAGSFTKDEFDELKASLGAHIENIQQEFDDVHETRRDLEKKIKEKEILINDIKNNRKTYPEHLVKAKRALETRLSDVYGRTINVYILADLFDVTQEEWKNAIEGRLGRLKLSLITQPQYAHDAAKYFRQMKQFEEVDLINSDAIVKSNPQVLDNSLYDTVVTKEKYVDACLRRYLGHIIKCDSIEELEAVKDGVTKDCYSYSNFIFRHLRQKDYKQFACIGSKVSKTKLEEYETDLEKLQNDYTEVLANETQFKLALKYENLDSDYEYYNMIAKAQKNLKKAISEKSKLVELIDMLKNGQYKEIQLKVEELRKQKSDIEVQRNELDKESNKLTVRIVGREKEIEAKAFLLEEKKMGYIADPETEAKVDEDLRTHNSQNLKNKAYDTKNKLDELEQQLVEKRQNDRNLYIKAYPSCGFNGMEKENTLYVEQLERYLTDYEPQYQEEFSKQCDLIYKILRENVIATIHGDIKAAMRHKNDINRMLRDTNFSDSTYQIKIEPAKNENGQFYEMLMAKELDNKNTSYNGCEGQLSFGEDEFYQTYQSKINLLIEKFMPPKDDDEKLSEQKQREMEQYADYRNYLSFTMFEQVTDENGNVIRENYVDEMAGRDSGGEGQNPKYVALLAGFAMLYMQQSTRDSKIKLVLLDEAFSKMDQERSEVCLNYARMMDLQLIVCVPDERVQSLIRNVDCVYGFRRFNNHISMLHIDKGDYLKAYEGYEDEEAVCFAY